MTAAAPEPDSTRADPGGYTVIARRYRPQRFEDVVGQDHVVRSLRNAIRMNRVTHAYLFSGTRGVGKTSVARIFAKCLNCVNGPTEEPCLRCDICQAIAVGQDVDVIEIDGASNNGVEAVRELRQNAGLRPSRARFKIYYIDEVHMLSTGAFNALLKTLEEPPPHVKFFFATTEPNKIPVTVLSRCQRYDFAGMSPDQVVETLAAICAQENIRAEPDALRAVARRAGGSMRDAQSLLEQLLSAGGETLTVELVHQRLGTASDERLLELIEALAERDAGAALTQLDRAANEGVQPADLLNGLLDFLRDLMVLAAGADDLLLTATPRQRPRLDAVLKLWPLDTVLAALQVFAESRARLRGSPHGRLLVELALARVARLESLTDLGELIGRLNALDPKGSPPSPAEAGLLVKKKLSPAEPAVNGSRAPEPAPKVTSPAPPVGAAETPSPPSSSPLDLDEVRQVWQPLIRNLGMRLGVPLSRAEPFLTVAGPGAVAVRVPAGYTGAATECGTPEALARIEPALSALLGRPVTLRVEQETGPARSAPAPAESAEPGGAARRREELSGDPMVKKVVELFEARLMYLDSEDDPPRDPAA